MNPPRYMRGNARPVPSWLWLFALLAIGSFVGLLMYLDRYEKSRGGESGAPELSKMLSPAPDADGAQSLPTTTNKTPAPEEKTPSFDFYSLLPKMEVLVPESEVTARIAKEQLQHTQAQTQTQTSSQAQSPTQTLIGSYFLQAGAFKDVQSADRMKAGLALLGVQSNIESVKLDNGVWHRVRVGPFADSKQMDKVRTLMKNNNISSITVKVNS